MKQRITYIFLLFSILFATGSTLVAQMGGMVNPVKFSQQITDDGKKIVTVSITASINSGWHLYDQNLPKGGPVPPDGGPVSPRSGNARSAGVSLPKLGPIVS